VKQKKIRVHVAYAPKLKVGVVMVVMVVMVV